VDAQERRRHRGGDGWLRDQQHRAWDAQRVFCGELAPRNANTFYGRFEAVQAETVLLQTGEVVDRPLADIKDAVLALTFGSVRDVWSWRGFERGLGADVTFYGVPDSLKPMYSDHPESFHVFFRLRPPVGSMGRMWNMRMSQPMAGHNMDLPMNHPMQ